MKSTSLAQSRQPHADRRWQRWSARGWIALAVLLTLVYLYGIPVYLQQAQTVCAAATPCAYPQVSAADLAALDAAQLPVSIYAWLGLLVPTLLFAACLAVGVLIMASRIADGFAIFTAYVLLGFGFQFGDVPAALAQVSPLWAAANRLLGLAQVSFFFFFYLFPDGRFVPSWTKIAAWVAVGYTLYTTWQLGANEGRTVDLLRSIIFPSLVASCLVAQVHRYRRVSTPVQRQQTKWVMVGIVLSLGGFLLLVTPFILFQSVAAISWYDLFVNVAIGLVWLPLIFAIAVAVLRYRLWDAELVVRRTLVYSVLSALLVLVFFGAVVLLQSLFVLVTGQQSQLAIVLSTLAIAALFTPLRTRIQDAIDRRFYRKKYDAQQVLAAFAITARDETDMNALTAELARVVQGALEPEDVKVWLRKR
jgi:hypothetical protein